MNNDFANMQTICATTKQCRQSGHSKKSGYITAALRMALSQLYQGKSRDVSCFLFRLFTRQFLWASERAGSQLIVGDFRKATGPFRWLSAVRCLNWWRRLADHRNLPSFQTRRFSDAIRRWSWWFTLFALSIVRNGIFVFLSNDDTSILIWNTPRGQELFLQVTVKRAFCGCQVRSGMRPIRRWLLLPLHHVPKIT